MHAAFMIKALGNAGGGAERVLVDVANGLAQRGHRISVITCDPVGTPSYYPLSPGIDLVQLDSGDTEKSSGLWQFLRRLRSYRRVLKARQPDVAVAFMHSSYIPAGAALLGTGIPLIASEHIGPEHYRSRLIERLLLQLTPVFADAITVVSEQIRMSYNRWLRRKMVVAHNPVSFNARTRTVANAGGESDCKILLSVGRMTEQKNQTCLIEAFGRIAGQFPEWRLRIAGDGPLRNALMAQIERLGLAERVQLPGNIADIGAEYENADLFVLPSRYESFGLATAEAILHGVPAVGFAGCPGTNELIRPGENGLLVEGNGDVDALAATLSMLMGNPDRLKRLRNSPTQWLQDAYGLNQVLDVWETLLVPHAKHGVRR
jgi:glycosyltransferase involved in cell wall biosynthesis